MAVAWFIDIGANLTDETYRGRYHGKQVHQGDLGDVLRRAEKEGLTHIIITAGRLAELRDAIALIDEFQPQTSVRLATTVGVHPTRTGELSTAGYLEELVALCRQHQSKIVAIGEVGLDYERLHFADKETQLAGYRALHVLHQTFPALPFFLHCRVAWYDLKRLNTELGIRPHGVVHCFTGTVEEAREILEAGWDIGLTGLAFKTSPQFDVVREIPLDRLHLETDCPYCDIKRSFAGAPFVPKKDAVKKERHSPLKQVVGRNEPANIMDVALACAKVKGVDLLDVVVSAHANSLAMFFPAN